MNTARISHKDRLVREDETLLEVPGGCPVLCSQHEACIEQRCVDMCRVGCRTGTYCTPDGSCEPLPQPQVPVLTEADRQRLAGASSAKSRLLVFADIGGVVGFGVKPGIEWGRKHSMIARLHLLNTGILSHAVYSDNEYRRFEWGFGTSIGYRHYEASWGNLRGFYYGGGLDYTAIRVADRVRTGAHKILNSVAPFGEFGYRWVFGDVAIGFGPTLALRYPIGTGFVPGNLTNCASPLNCDDPSGRRFEGTLHVEIGLFQ